MYAISSTGASAAPREQKKNQRILIIDDNSAIHQDVRKILGVHSHEDESLDSEAAALFGTARTVSTRTEFEIDSAFQGQQGLEMAEKARDEGRPYALAFVDVRMPPGWNGIETIGHLWRACPELQVVICTAYSDYSWEEMIQNLGKTDSLVILKKPFDNIEVLQLAHTLTQKWCLSHRLQQHLAGLDQTVAERTEELEAANARLRQSQKLEAVGQLAAGVAHDFNNILTIIQGHATMQLASSDLQADVANSFDQVSMAAERAAGLTRQLLAFSRKQIVLPRALDLNVTVQNVQDMLRRLIGEHIHLRCEFADELPEIFADESNVEQIVMNLVVNARDAMEQGGHLTIRTELIEVTPGQSGIHPDARPGRFACLRVRDTGCGMSPETLSHIFEPFFTTKEVGKGTGLGLATVYGIVAQHEGWVEVESEVGRGTAIRVHLPLSETPSAVEEKPIEPAPSSLRGGHETILLVEDETDVREIVSGILESHGYHVIGAADGPEALDVWTRREREVDLLVTDIMMPNGLRGNALAARLRNEKPGLKVIYSSGYSQDVAAESTEFAGQCVFLQKPYKLDGLIRAVRDCLDGTQHAS